MRLERYDHKIVRLRLMRGQSFESLQTYAQKTDSEKIVVVTVVPSRMETYGSILMSEKSQNLSSNAYS